MVASVLASLIAMSCACDSRPRQRQAAPIQPDDVPPDAAGRFYQANAWLEMDRPSEAAAIYEQLLSETGRDAAIVANLAICRLAAQELDQAAALALEASAAAPKNADVGVVLAAVRSAQGRSADAVTLLGELVEKNPGHVGAAAALAIALEAEADGDRQRLVAAWQRLAGLVPRNTHVLLRLAELHARGGDAQTALTYLDRFAAVAVDLPEAVRQDWQALPEFAASGNSRRVLSVAVTARNVMKLTDRYRADVHALGPPPGGLPPAVPHLVSLPLPSPGNAASPAAEIRFRPAGELLPPLPEDVIDVAIGTVSPDRSPALYLVRSGGPGRLLVRGGLSRQAMAAAATEPGSTTTATAPDAPAAGNTAPGKGSSEAASDSTPMPARFVDETEAAGLNDAPACTAALFVDLDNDRSMDLLLCGPSGMCGYRNEGGQRFRDATGAFGLADIGETRGAIPFDFDHDGDLDLVRWDADRALLHRNDGEGRLSAAIERPGFPADMAGIHRVHALDLDDDGDIDLAFVVGGADGKSGDSLANPTTGRGADLQNGGPAESAAGGEYSLRVISNERLATFREVTEEMKGLPKKFRAEPILADMDNDGWLEIVDPVRRSRYPIREEFAILDPVHPLRKEEHAPPAIHGTMADFDNNGRVELLVVDPGGSTNLTGMRFASATPPYPVDLNGDGLPDVIGANGQAFINQTQNPGHWLSVSLAALIQGDSKFNAFGIGSTIEVRAGGLYQKRHVSLPWTHFGLGPYTTADVLRVVWPNGSYQNIAFRVSDRVALAADRLIVEEQTLKGSCPYLYAWNGARFEFATDVLWRSALGMSIMSDVFGHHGPADDYFKIEGRQLAARDGRYVLQFTEELWETAYFDYCRLFAVDHPAGTDVFVDEKCLAPPYPPLRIFRVRERRQPASAVDQHGRDLLPLLRHRDRRYVGGFALTRYQGIVEDHELILDAGPFAAGEDVKLFLQGWLWPTDASTNVAVSQNPSLAARPPVLSVVGEDGRWTTLDMEVGFPSGKDKTMVLDLSARFPTADHRVRLSTNFAIYWDCAFFTVGPQEFDVTVTELDLLAADLHERGFSIEYRAAPEGPTVPDYHALDRERQWRDLVGDYTRFGDVLPLVRHRDGAYAIVGPGDEITLHFDATRAPAMPDGWRRDFIVHTDGWLKDGDLNSATGKTVEPLPYTGMSAFPPPAGEARKALQERRELNERYHTRPRGAERFRDAVRKPNR